MGGDVGNGYPTTEMAWGVIVCGIGKEESVFIKFVR
jgi:hypothetical protein